MIRATNITAVLTVLLVFTGCAGSGIALVERTEMPDSWEQRIGKGRLGLADYPSDRLVNLDIWPRLRDGTRAEYTPGCREYLERRGEPLEIMTRFKVTAEGRTDSLTIMGKAGACRKSAIQTVGMFRFMPGKKEGRSIPAVAIYPLTFSFSPEERP